MPLPLEKPREQEADATVASLYMGLRVRPSVPTLLKA
jgi:hypothetical protein